MDSEISVGIPRKSLHRISLTLLRKPTVKLCQEQDGLLRKPQGIQKVTPAGPRRFMKGPVVELSDSKARPIALVSAGDRGLWIKC